MKELTKKQIKDKYDKLTKINKKIVKLAKSYRTIKGNENPDVFFFTRKTLYKNKPNNDITNKIELLEKERKPLLFDPIIDVPYKLRQWWGELKGLSKRDSQILEAVIYDGIHSVLKITKK